MIGAQGLAADAIFAVPISSSPGKPACIYHGVSPLRLRSQNSDDRRVMKVASMMLLGGRVEKVWCLLRTTSSLPHFIKVNANSSTDPFAPALST